MIPKPGDERRDDIFALGWRLALHNEVGLGCNITCHYLFTKGGRCVHGEGPSDAEALNAVRHKLGIARAPFVRARLLHDPRGRGQG
jgi:hypothetical protein